MTALEVGLNIVAILCSVPGILRQSLQCLLNMDFPMHFFESNQAIKTRQVNFWKARVEGFVKSIRTGIEYPYFQLVFVMAGSPGLNENTHHVVREC
jgi:hypothetical protein